MNLRKIFTEDKLSELIAVWKDCINDKNYVRIDKVADRIPYEPNIWAEAKRFIAKELGNLARKVIAKEVRDSVHEEEPRDDTKPTKRKGNKPVSSAPLDVYGPLIPVEVAVVANTGFLIGDAMDDLIRTGVIPPSTPVNMALSPAKIKEFENTAKVLVFEEYLKI